MVAPLPDAAKACGVADYVGYLLPELRRRADVRLVVDAERFGPEMNAVDVIHVQHQYFLFGGVAPWKNRFGRFVRRLSAPSVMTVHEIVPATGKPTVRAAVRATNRMQFLAPSVQRLIVHTEADRRALMAEGVTADRIEVVRHGVPAAPVMPSRDEARRDLGLSRSFVLTVFGFLARRKGHLLAIEAMSELPNDVVLLLAGGSHPDDRSEYPDAVQTEIEQSGLGDRVRVTGYLSPEQVARVMSATDVALAPFTSSSGSGSLAMAFACGKPILASDIAPHREIAVADATALRLFPSGNPSDLARAIIALREETGALDRLAEGARDYATVHSYGRMAEETVQVYSTAIAERAA